jgi:HAE1 family hydrophobic/amphiphilic exporter-1
VILVALGFVSMSGLPIELFPEIEFPLVSVSTEYDGVAPQEIEERVTRPIEQVVAAVEDVKSVRSKTIEGLSHVYIEFNWGTDTDLKRLDVREKLDRIRGALPDDIDDPIVSKRSFGADPQAIRIAISSEFLPLTEVRRLAEDIFKPRLESIEDVATVEIIGGRRREIQVNTIPRQLGSYDLTLAEIVATLRAENLNQPGGRFERGRSDLLLRTVGKFGSLEEIRNLPIANRNGAVVTIADVAEVEDTFREVRALSRYNGLETVELSVMKEAQGNAVSISDGVRSKVAELGLEFPQLEFGVAFDSSLFIREAVLNVRENATWGGFFAILVLWPFLSRRRWGVFLAIAASGVALLLADPLIEVAGGGLAGVLVVAAAAIGALLVALLWTSSPATLIVSIAIPVSIIATFILIKFAGLSLNVISLGGLALGIGMLVDNSVVVIENIARHMSMGKGSRRAAVEGASEVALAIVVSTLTTLAVFLPIAWIEGIAREVFNDLSLTVSFSLSTSLLVAITIVPMLASKFLRAEGTAELDRAPTPEEEAAALNEPQRRLRAWLLWILEKRRRISTVLAGAACLFLLTMVGLALHPKGFFPSQDRDTFAISIDLPKGSSFETVDGVVRRIEEVIRRDPEVESTFASVRIPRTMVGVTLRKDRRRHSEDIQGAIRSRLSDVPDTKVMIFNFSSSGGGRPVDIEILGNDLDRLAGLGAVVKAKLEAIRGVLDVRSSSEEGRPELQVRIDRLKAADYGLSVREVADAVETAMDGRIAGQYSDEGEEMDIRVQYHPDHRRTLSSLEDLGLRNAVGVPTVLREVARLRTDLGPVEIDRIDQRRMVHVDSEKDRRISIAEIAADLTERLRDTPIPVGYLWRFSGEESRRAEAFGGLAMALMIAICLVYMIMAALFESLMQPFVIMLTLPLGMVGVYLGLALFGHELTVPAYVGIIMLSGIVVNNAIVFLDYVNRLRRRGLDRRAALSLAAGVRLRPILMTAGTTVLGMLPLALGIGRGSQVFQALASGVAGGIATSTVLTLLVLPCAYDVVDRLAGHVRSAVARLGVNIEDPYAREPEVHPPASTV